MSNLTSAIDELHATPSCDLSDEEVTAELVEVYRSEQRLAARRVELVGVADRRRFFEDVGFGSAMAWVRSLLGVRHGIARWWVSLGRSLRHMPGARAAFVSGEVSEDRMRPLTEARTQSPADYTAGEGTLLDAARELGPTEFRRVVEYWKDAADPDRYGRSRERMVAERGLHLSRTWEGRSRIDGWLDPESHIIVDTALGTYVDRATRDPADDRTPAQVRVDGLVDICRTFLRHGDTPTRAGEPVQVLVTVDLDTLETRAGRGAVVGDSHVTAEDARRLACDAKITRIITHGPSEPLDVGRATRTVTPAQWKALVVRDGGCAADGCDIPAAWCDAHHLVHWVDGGPTDLLNLILLCRRHHRLIHQGELELRPRGRDPAP